MKQFDCWKRSFADVCTILVSKLNWTMMTGKCVEERDSDQLIQSQQQRVVAGGIAGTRACNEPF